MPKMESPADREAAPGSRPAAGDGESGWLVYLVRCADDTLYCGVTTDLDRRLAQHNGLLPGGARYTRGRRPVRLLAARPCADRARAQQLEYAIKHCRREEKLAALAGTTPACPPATTRH